MSSTAPLIFDRALLRARRDRVARRCESGGRASDFLFRAVAEQLCDRLLDFNRRFGIALELGARDGVLGDVLPDLGRVDVHVRSELSSALLRLGAGRYRVAADEESLPFRAQAFDLVLSNLVLHWTNDLPGALVQIMDALKPDGLFLASLFGAGTLGELRHSLIEAETAETGGASVRVAPFADLRDAAGLMQRAGFALPVADRYTIQVTYADPLELLNDLRAMGEASVLAERPRLGARRALFRRLQSVYRERFALPDGRVPATFEILFLAGWAPHSSQQRPARRGSGEIDLGKALR